MAELAAGLDHAARRRLGRSLSIRAVDAGSCNGCELEIQALNNAFYDLERFGLHIVASPRHADVLLELESRRRQVWVLVTRHENVAFLPALLPRVA